MHCIVAILKFLNLTTLREVNRDQWTELPMPDIVLARINEMADKQSRKLSKDPRFSRGVDGEQEVIYNEVDDNLDTSSYAEELVQITHTDRMPTSNLEQIDIDNNNMIDPVNTEPIIDNAMIEDYRGESNDSESQLKDLPDIQYQLDEDGDVIMNDSDAIFHEYVQPKVSSEQPTHQSEITQTNNIKDTDISTSTHNYSL